MLHLTSQSKIMIAIEPVDFRKQIDGLAAICRNNFNTSPIDGSLYVFINRSKTSVKILHYENGGYWLAIKRLSRGKYLYWPASGSKLTPVMASQLQKILKSMVDLKN